MSLFFIELCFTLACMAVMVTSLLMSGAIMQHMVDRYARRTRKLSIPPEPGNPQIMTNQQDKDFWRNL